MPATLPPFDRGALMQAIEDINERSDHCRVATPTKIHVRLRIEPDGRMSASFAETTETTDCVGRLVSSSPLPAFRGEPVDAGAILFVPGLNDDPPFPSRVAKGSILKAAHRCGLEPGALSTSRVSRVEVEFRSTGEVAALHVRDSGTPDSHSLSSETVSCLKREPRRFDSGHSRVPTRSAPPASSSSRCESGSR